MSHSEAIAVVGIGTTGYLRRGSARVGALGQCARAVRAASHDAGLHPADIDGFVSYAEDQSEPPRLAAALGSKEVRWASLVWGGGAGGLGSAFDHARAALQSGSASYVVIVRAIAQRSQGRLSSAVSGHYLGAHHRAHGVVAPAQVCAMRTRRMLDIDGVPASTLRAVAMADYFHAQNNPSAVGRDVQLDATAYEASRWIVEPYRLYDCSRENDGAAALVLTTKERALDRAKPPVYLIGATQSGSVTRGDCLENDDDFSTAGYGPVAHQLWSSTGLRPHDIDVVQVHDNFTGVAVAALIDHGFCTAENAGEVIAPQNLRAPTGGLPLNTSGGSLAEGMLHGINAPLEAVRQVRGESCNQVADVELSLLIGGPAGPLVSSALFGSESLT